MSVRWEKRNDVFCAVGEQIWMYRSVFCSVVDDVDKDVADLRSDGVMKEIRDWKILCLRAVCPW